MGKKIGIFFTALLICLISLTGCSSSPQKVDQNARVQIIATLFPQYDFARQIAGDRADVTLLLSPGVESHTFEPTPADIIKINECDLFVYTGNFMEPWAETIISGMTGNGKALDVSKGITLDAEEETHEGDEEHEGHHHGGFDPHIWTDPLNAKVMVQNITDALCEADEKNKEYYQSNAQEYLVKLDALDAEFQEIVSTAERDELVFGGRFAFHYFVKRYDLNYISAFDSFTSETEPSVSVIAQIMDQINEKQIPVIFYEELTDPKVSRAIADETGVKMLMLHACHNVSKEDLQNGATYLSIMEQNAKNLKEGLN